MGDRQDETFPEIDSDCAIDADRMRQKGIHADRPPGVQREEPKIKDRMDASRMIQIRTIDQGIF